MNDYYDATGIPPAEVLRRWRRERRKAYDGVYMVPVEQLWPYREYHWRRDCARGGPEHWDQIRAGMRERGWDQGDPAWVSVGHNGVMKVGEGNHRLAIARTLGIARVPVIYHFGERISYEQDPCAGMSRHGHGPRVHPRRKVVVTESAPSPRGELSVADAGLVDELMGLLGMNPRR
jgi:hypothetical protein